MWTTDEIRARKGGTPLVCLTAYTTPVAQRLAPHCDMLLVGDSVAMVVYGLAGTRDVDLDTMIRHASAVVRGAPDVCVVVDLPYGSYEAGADVARASAERVLRESGAQAVKLEGGGAREGTIRHLVDAGIPVMGHVGLQPQRLLPGDPYRVQGRTTESWNAVMADALAVERAGAFAVVVEAVIEPLGRAVTRALAIPSIGIGASASCDGQILVSDDMLGVFRDFTPSFVRRYAELGDAMDHAAAAYADDVRARRFPEARHCYAGEEPTAASRRSTS